MSYFEQYVLLASHSILWWAPFFALIYVFFFILNKFRIHILQPSTAMLIFGLLGIFTMPTIGKYQFEKWVLSEFETASEFKLVASSSAFSIGEPLAYMLTPKTHFTFVMPMMPPQSNPYSFASGSNDFMEVKYAYGEQETWRMVSTMCDDEYIGISEEVDGLLKIVDERKMYPIEKKHFCDTDYSEQSEIAFCKQSLGFEKMSDIQTEEEFNAFMIEADKQCTE